jgi:biotin carboxylase
MSRVLLLIPSASYRTPDFMKAAASLDIDVVVGSDRRNPLADDSGLVAFSFVDAERGAEEIEEFANRHPLDTIVAVDDGGTVLAARASRRLELPHNPVAAVEATRNKAELRARIAAAGLPSPCYRVEPTSADPATIEGISFPVVLKPLALSASRGVIRANDRSEFVKAFERIRRILDTPSAHAECGPELADRVLIEQYIPGIEVSVEGLLDGGRLQMLALFDKPDPLEGPYFEETIYVTPSRLSEADQAAVAEASEAACRALGLTEGAVHAELRLNGDGIFAIDIAARSIGGLCSRTLSFGTGMSLEELILRHAIGVGVPSYERETAASGVIMIPIPHAGTLRAIEGVETAEAVPLIESVTIEIRPGNELVPLPEGSEYLGFIFARGADPSDDPAAVEQALRDAHAALTFEIE